MPHFLNQRPTGRDVNELWPNDCIGLHVLLSILNYLSSRLPVLLLSSVDVALLLCRLVVVVDGYHLAVVDGCRSVVVVVIAASSKGVGRCRRRLAGAGIAPSFGIDLAMVDWRRSVVVVASLSSPTLTCCCWWWYVTSARGLAQPAGRSAFAKLAITGRGKLGVIRELLTLHHELLIINQPYHHDYDLGMRLDNDNGWPAIRQQQTPAGTPSTVGRPRPRRHYSKSAMARQVEHDNEDEDDNGPRRQWPTTTTAYDSNGLRRQRPTTVVCDDTDNDNGSSGDTATMPSTRTNEYESSTSHPSENSDEYSYSRVSLVDISTHRHAPVECQMGKQWNMWESGKGNTWESAQAKHRGPQRFSATSLATAASSSASSAHDRFMAVFGVFHQGVRGSGAGQTITPCTGRVHARAHNPWPIPSPVTTPPHMRRKGVHRGMPPSPTLLRSHIQGEEDPFGVPPSMREHATPAPPFRAMRHMWKGAHEGKPPPAGGSIHAGRGPPPYVSHSGASMVSVHPCSLHPHHNFCAPWYD
ncbi:hypothetical protein EDB89DRAFT_1909328 [Lactarius sanguifluus]|nr:hypothetical protein EDB89DRAFT_1909328 [Lactarius sanguifluus]